MLLTKFKTQFFSHFRKSIRIQIFLKFLFKLQGSEFSIFFPIAANFIEFSPAKYENNRRCQASFRAQTLDLTGYSKVLGDQPNFGQLKIRSNLTQDTDIQKYKKAKEHKGFRFLHASFTCKNRYKGYYLETWIEGYKYLHTWDSRFLQCFDEEYLTGQEEGRVVHSSKPLGIYQTRRFCISPTVKGQPHPRNDDRYRSIYCFQFKYTIQILTMVAIPLVVNMYRT